MKSLKVLTWNIWFGNLSRSLRYESIMTKSLDAQPDVICFQECTPYFVVNHLSKNHRMMAEYEMSDDGIGSSLGSYGVLMLIKKELVPSFSYSSFQSNMGRGLMLGCIKIQNETVSFGTVHLESLANHDYRTAQLRQCNIQLSSSHNILCGDFNFCSYRNYSPKSGVPLENDSLAVECPGYVDMWTRLVLDPYTHRHGTESLKDIGAIPEDVVGYTFDSVVNTNIDHYERFRIDRVCYKFPVGDCSCSTRCILSPHSISLLGNQPISVSSENDSLIPSIFRTPTKEMQKPPLFPSDHFGLLAEFTVAE